MTLQDFSSQIPTTLLYVAAWTASSTTDFHVFHATHHFPNLAPPAPHSSFASVVARTSLFSTEIANVCLSTTNSTPQLATVAL